MNLLEARIDLSAIAHNTRLLAEYVAPAKLMCVVKADAYNHGAPEVAKVMAQHGAHAFGVATLDEALALREAGITQEILAWIWAPEQDVRAALEHRIDLAVISPRHAQALISLGIPARVYIKVDTGMHRSGVHLDDLHEVFVLLREHPQIEVLGVMSHLACADEPNNPMNARQKDLFSQAIAMGRELGFALPTNHLANSPGVFLGQEFHYNMVRPGVALYGMEPIPGTTHGLRPAMQWVARVTVLKHVAAGEPVSYGGTWHAPTDGVLAVIPAGYADGVPRAAQGRLDVTIGGHAYPQVGRVCMDQVIVDLGDNPHGVSQGDEAIIFGPGGVSAEELAGRLSTIHYEVICRPTGRTHRVYTTDLNTGADEGERNE
ncbi:alanine racemase [Corynebacterium sp. 153RC1]|uniref:alanine racemase n=1 Tax=unclassified Corynebacterium TaxID=2624378 RepID=UPI00211C412B|nr:MULTISPECIES: alanine racemase [unclassified Corynebacterium]MCQ9371346.1 alanine racemase [Corynebacterium sp. 35RC1]MCQ9352216.1 alanine racemase [Corynebacterium sp. 209RC1]MCQ9354219.1 alanine racemase [Corynebacterium sp. 1222RC1]MCQ9356499.1 alanine racemase [Corynebacterium sp. 122RC1]MCQ9358601.1 alanine racemase [Corynebacterium sp. 142RC1]